MHQDIILLITLIYAELLFLGYLVYKRRTVPDLYKRISGCDKIGVLIILTMIVVTVSLTLEIYNRLY